MTTIIVQLVISGVLLGGIYALISVGLTLIFGVSRIKNFAHGDFVMLAMYISYSLSQLLSADPYIILPLTTVMLFVFGVLISMFIIRPINKAPQVAQIFATVGLGLVLQNIVLMWYGADFRTTKSVISNEIIRFQGVSISAPLLTAFVVAISVIALITLFLKKSYTGKAMRAVSQNRKAAMLMCIDVKKIDMFTFGLGAACAGLAGALLAPIYPSYPTIGMNLVLICFVVVVLGGLGSVEGALVGGILIGMIETLSGFFIGSELRQLAYFIVFICVLLLKPAGLFGKRGSETLGA